MKILNVYKTYFPDPPGGIQEAIRNISFATTRLNIKNLVFVLSKNAKPSFVPRQEAEVHRANAFADPASCELGSWQAFNMFARLSKQVDIIQYHFPWPFQDVLHLFVKPNKPTVLCYHSDIVRQKFLGKVYNRLMWRTLKSVDCIIATSPNYAETSPILSNPMIRDKVQVIPLGIEEAHYDFTEDDHVFERINHSINHRYFLFLGVFRYYKGLQYLIESASQVEATIILAGSGPELENMRAYVQQLNCHNVIFAGQVTQSEKVSLMKHCCAFILPSHLRSEAFGVVLIEAAMMQKPMITCEIGTGTSYVNQHQETGFVVKPENVSQLSEAMNFLIKDSSLAISMGIQARKRYEQLFSGNALGEAYKAVYQQLLKIDDHDAD
jgi:glycosyltransferase involved in cell wall biosynthesis